MTFNYQKIQHVSLLGSKEIKVSSPLSDPNIVKKGIRHIKRQITQEY